MTNDTQTRTATYWRTRYGSLCERQAGPDVDGWITVMRLNDGAIRTWQACQMSAVPDAEAIAECNAALAGVGK